jgi:hypothetical protein
MFSLIKSHNHQNKVHTFGIGSGASESFVVGAAEAGKGSHVMIPDGDTSINAKVIKALKLASRPAFNQITIDWGTNKDAVKFSVPNETSEGMFYEEDPIEICALLDSQSLSKGELKLSFSDTLHHKQKEYTFTIDPENILVSENDNCFKSVAKKYISELESLIKKGEDAKSTDLVETSVKYSVLCKETSFFGKVKNKKKSTEKEEIIQMKVETSKSKQYYYDVSDLSNIYLFKPLKIINSNLFTLFPISSSSQSSLLNNFFKSPNPTKLILLSTPTSTQPSNSPIPQNFISTSHQPSN